MTQKLSSEIDKILDAARHSPSSHNTQPWLVKVQGSRLTVGYNSQRHLSVGDPKKHELIISLGCFVESICIAASESGYVCHLTYPEAMPETIVILHLRRESAGSETGDTKLLKKRTSDRRLYDNRSLPSETIEHISSLNEHPAHLMLVTDPVVIKFLATQTHTATYAAMSNPAFRDELASWVRNNWTKKHDGMPAYTQGIPGPVSLLAKIIISKNKAIAKAQAKKDSQRVERSAAIALIHTAGTSNQSLIAAGRLYQRACITALRDDVKSSGISAAVVDASTSSQIASTLDLPAYPVALIRFGYTKNNTKASPRLPLSAFVIGNETT